MNKSLAIPDAVCYTKDAKMGFTDLSHYCDDGISGTRFDRPGFVKMMDDIEAGKVQIVLCKDTSRLGKRHKPKN